MNTKIEHFDSSNQYTKLSKASTSLFSYFLFLFSSFSMEFRLPNREDLEIFVALTDTFAFCFASTSSKPSLTIIFKNPKYI